MIQNKNVLRYFKYSIWRVDISCKMRTNPDFLSNWMRHCIYVHILVLNLNFSSCGKDSPEAVWVYF